MSDVFISYARSTEREADRIAEALRRLGYGIWRDDELPAHRGYADVIEERLAAAKAVVVVWSADAVKSEWVQSEADFARNGHKLIQLRIDSARLPMPFDRIQCADLANWSGDAAAPGWRQVADSVAALVRGDGAPAIGAAPARPARTTAAPLLAVLAFDNLSGDPEMAYFSDGISEEIRETVARGADLEVIGRASSFQFRGAAKAAARVAAEVGATHVLDGAVRRSGQRVRINTDLVQCATQTTLWSNRFDRDLTDIFAVQDEIAAAVAEALKAAFRPAAAEPIDPALYDLFLKARARLRASQLASESIAEALAQLEHVVAAAPTFVPAWATLAFTCARGLRLGTFPESARTQARAAAETALRLDPRTAIAYQALAYLEPVGRYLERECLEQRAMEVAPNEAEVLATYSRFCQLVGRPSEAADLCGKAYALDALDPSIASHYAGALGAADRYEESTALWDELPAKWPQSDIVGFVGLYWTAAHGDWTRFDALAEAGRKEGWHNRSTLDVVDRWTAVRRGDEAFWGATLARFRADIESGRSPELDLLVGLYEAGFQTDVWDLVDRASYAEYHSVGGLAPVSSGLVFWPTAKTMRRDGRFMKLCGKLGLCDYWTATGRWPECADEVSYDFRGEATRLAAEGQVGRA